MRKTRQLKHGDIRITIYPKTGARIGKSTGKRRKKRMSWSQAGEFLNRYDFSHSGRHTVNQIGKIAPKIIRGAIEELYKTPFRLLAILRKKQFNIIKRKLFK